MAKTQTAHIVITANAKAAVEVMKMLKEQTDIYINRLDALTQKKKQGVQLTKAEEKEAKELEKKIQALTTAQQKNQAEYRKTRDVMKNIAGSTTKDLKRAYAELAKMANSTTGEQTWRQEVLRKKMQEVKAQIDKNTGAINSMSKAQSGFGGALGTTLKNLVAYAGVFQAFGKIKSLISGVFESNLKLSDSLADIRKVAGLSSEAINQLYRNIAQIDSRNTIETLNSLAYTGAKLGIGQNYGVEGLTGFVKAAEQVQMALGEDMGEDALPALAKMTEVMGLIDKYGVEQSMQKAASAIFQLGATSTATGTNIVEFSKRLYGLANVSRVSADDLLALGSAADAMGLMPEVAATAFNKLFTSVQKNHNMIEKTLSLQPGLIKSYYDQGKTMDAIVAIFEKMNQTGNLNLLGNVFKDLGSDGARLVNVMATMSDRVDILKKHLDTSREAFKEGEAVIGEYMIQNQTAQALMERASNLWAKAFTNPEGVDMVKQMAQAWYDLSKSMTQNEGMMYSMRLSIQLIGLAIESLVKLMPVLIHLMMFAGVGMAIRGVIVGIQAMGAAIRAAATAQMTFNAAIRSNALLALVSGIATAIAMFVEYSNAAEEAAKRQAEQEAKLKASFDKSKEAVQSIVKPLETYKKVLDEANLSEKQKMELVNDFRNAYQDYLDYLGIEVKTVDDLRDAYARVVEVMKIKKAYEERESFRTEKNGQNRMDRIGNQAQVESQLRSMGITDIDKEWLEKNQRLGTGGMYDAIMRRRYGSGVVKVEGTGRGRYVIRNSKGELEEVGSSALYDIIGDYIRSYRTERDTNKGIDEMFDTEFTWTDADGKKRKLSEFDLDDYNRKVQEARWKRKGSLDNDAPDKEALKAAKKEQQERKKELKLELDQAKENADGLIAKIDEWYNLQEAAVKDAEAMGQMSKQNAEDLVKMMEIARNQSLAKARKAVGSGEQQAIDDWQTWAKTVLPSMLADSSEWSAGLMNTIQQVDAKALHDFLKRFDGSKAMAELDASSFLDTIMKKGAGSLKKAQVLRAQFKERTDKYVEQYQVIDTAQKELQKDLQALGIMTETYEEMAQRIAENRKKGDNVIAPSQQRVERTATAFINQQGRKQYSDSPQDMGRWLTDLSSQKGAEWTAGLPQVRQWLSDVEKYKGEIAAFYKALADYEQAYLDKNEDATREAADRLSQLLTARISDAQAYNAMGLKFVGQGTIPYTIDITNQQEALQWLKNFATDSEGELEQWAQAFPKITALVKRIKAAEKDGTLGETELQSLQDAMPQIEALYLKLINYSDNVGKNIEQQVNAMMPSRAPIGVSEMTQQYNQRRSLTESLYQQQIDQANALGGPKDENGDNAAAIELKQQRDQQLIDMEYQYQQQLWQIREQMGVTVFDEYEHEVAMYKNMLDKKLISEQQFQKKRGQLQMKLGLNMAQQYNGMMSNMVNALQEAEIASVEAKYDAEINAAQAAGQDTATLEAQKEAEIYEIRRKYATLQLGIKISEIIANTAVAIMAAYAQLGPIGGSIAAALIGAYGAAQLILAKAEYDKVMSSGGGGTKKSTSSAKTKLASGMLTYDEGNADRVVGSKHRKLYDDGSVQVYDRHDAQSSPSGDRREAYLGTDGHIYRATPQPALPDGVQLIRRPIATTVNGQPSLVAERGPEIIIGRRATRHIQMNEPGLLHHLAAINGRYRTYDEGTVPVGSPDGAPSLSGMAGGEADARVAAALEQNTQMMAAFVQMMNTIQQRGIRAHIQKYGADGLIEEVKSGLKFDQRYNR